MEKIAFYFSVLHVCFLINMIYLTVKCTMHTIKHTQLLVCASGTKGQSLPLRDIELDI